MPKPRLSLPAGAARALFFSPLLLLIILAARPPALAQRATASTPEQKTARHFESIKAEPLELYMFLRQMPKGADLHNHMTGSVYAESYVRWAAEAGMCVDRKTMLLFNGPCDEASGRPAASTAMTDGVLYRSMIDAWSMRNSEYAGQSGHDQFFDSFGKFGLAGNNRYGDMLAEVTARAASGRVAYMELMLTPDNGKSRDLGRQLKWPDGAADASPAELAKVMEQMRQELLRLGISQAVREGQNTLNIMEARRKELLKCDDPNKAAPGCGVTVRYIFQIARANPPAQAFAQMVAAMEMALVEPRLVALNLVQAEDSLPSMTYFPLQMLMLDYLNSVYPKVNITLHAGELAPGLVPPDGLRFHVRDSVRKGHAKRIGHGVAVAYEDDPVGLLREMSEKRVMVEICLSSNDGILGVRGKQHPLPLYLKFGVPVALATDDEGVSRSEMTREFVKAVEDHGLGYVQLKAMARTSLEHAFVEGASLWKDAGRWLPVSECKSDRAGDGSPSGECQRFLKGNEKARLQWALEGSFADFEKKH
ncbi:MAG TPA: adenosine deaminase [Blastocatellia bacterium]|nr:adenosine deaminase [Blastocatellia bacterium]